MHNIKNLADCLNRYMGHLTLIGPANRIDPASWKLLAWLDSEDETGETYRLRHGRQGNQPHLGATGSGEHQLLRPDQRTAQARHLLHGGYSTTWTSTSRCRRTSASTDARAAPPGTAALRRQA